MHIVGKERDLRLDGLRGLAVVLVVMAHITGSRAEPWGITGVTVFFVLSGYLITRLLLKERARTGQINMRAFYARRFLRLAPALVMLIASTPLLMWATDDPRLEGSALGLLAGLLYVQDYVGAFGGDSVVMHTWSLQWKSISTFSGRWRY